MYFVGKMCSFELLACEYVLQILLKNYKKNKYRPIRLFISFNFGHYIFVTKFEISELETLNAFKKGNFLPKSIKYRF